jgi:hypothetical protein
MISALAPNRPDQAFYISGLPRRAERCGPVPNAHRSHPSLEHDAKCSIIVTNEIFRCAAPRERFSKSTGGSENFEGGVGRACVLVYDCSQSAFIVASLGGRPARVAHGHTCSSWGLREKKIGQTGNQPLLDSYLEDHRQEQFTSKIIDKNSSTVYLEDHRQEQFDICYAAASTSTIFWMALSARWLVVCEHAGGLVGHRTWERSKLCAG